MATQDRTEVQSYEAIDAFFTDLSEAGNLIRNFFKRNVLAGTIVGKTSSDRDLIFGKAQVEGGERPFGLAMYLSHGIPMQIFFSKNFDVVRDTGGPATSDYTVNMTRIGSKLSAETSGNPLHLNEPFGAWVASKLASLSGVIREYNAITQASTV